MGGDGKGMRDEVYVQRERERERGRACERKRERESERGSLVVDFPKLNPLPSKCSVYVLHCGLCLFIGACVHKHVFINTEATSSMTLKSVISELVTYHSFANLGY